MSSDACQLEIAIQSKKRQKDADEYLLTYRERHPSFNGSVTLSEEITKSIDYNPDNLSEFGVRLFRAAIVVDVL